MHIGKTSALAAATVAALALTTIDLRPAAAASSDGLKPAGIQAAGVDEMSARKRQRHVRHYRHRGNAGAAQAFGAIAGTIGGIIAADQARKYYRRHYYQPYYGSYGYAPYGYAPYGYAPYGGYGYYRY
jgi:hypothetical protein